MDQSSPETPSPDQIRAALARVLASPAFAGARRPSDLLRYIVTEAMEGRSGGLKEYALGADALGRGSTFDPRIDPIARVEASRLRSRLDLYYAADGRTDPVVIALPKGGYAPHIIARPAAPAPAAKPAPAPKWLSGWIIPAAAAATTMALAAIFIAWSPWRRPEIPLQPMMQLEVATGAPGEIAADVGSSLAISPDGSTVAMSMLQADGSTRLFVRRLDSLTARELPGTIGARGPFFSPDGRWVGFWSEGAIRKTLTEGGSSPVMLARASDLFGATWSEDGTILATIARHKVLWRVPEEGGEATPLINFGDSPAQARWPQVLPGGKAVLVTSTVGQGASTTIDVVPLDGRPRATLLRGGTFARYVASGHILYLDRGKLFAVPFDAKTLKLRGEPFPVVDGVAYGQGFGYAVYDVSRTGVLVYQHSTSGGLSTLQWIEGEKTQPVIAEPGRYLWPRLSPDGKQLAYSLLEGSDYDLWIWDIAAHAKTRLTVGGGGQTRAIWTPDGAYLLYMDDDPAGIFWRRAGRQGDAKLLLSGISVPWSFTPDGKRLAFHDMGQTTGFDLATAPLTYGPDGLTAGPRKAFLGTRAFETYPAFSPDGRWMAYSSDESGVWEIYVRAWPDDGRKVRVSTNGGHISAWSRTAPELFYETNGNRMMVARYSTRSGVFIPEAPRLWSSRRLADTGVLSNYDLAPDGRRIIAMVDDEGGRAPSRNQITLVLNFFDELRRSR